MKPWWKSKTVWANVLTSIASILLLLQGESWIAKNPETVAILGTIMGMLNIVLRFITKTEVSLRGK
jgi:hypothetical protein